MSLDAYTVDLQYLQDLNRKGLICRGYVCYPRPLRFFKSVQIKLKAGHIWGNCLQCFFPFRDVAYLDIYSDKHFPKAPYLFGL